MNMLQIKEALPIYDAIEKLEAQLQSVISDDCEVFVGSVRVSDVSVKTTCIEAVKENLISRLTSLHDELSKL